MIQKCGQKIDMYAILCIIRNIKKYLKFVVHKFLFLGDINMIYRQILTL